MTISGYDREARLSDVRTDPIGWGSIDLSRLLDSFEFDAKDLGISGGASHTLWSHPADRSRLFVVIKAADPVTRSTVDQVVWVIDELRRLLRSQ